MRRRKHFDRASIRNSLYETGKRGFRLKNRINEALEGHGLYRSRNSIIMGVCRGIAEHFNLSVFWVRAITLLLFLMSGIWPVGVLYVVIGLLLKPEPVVPIKNEVEQEFYDSYTHSRSAALQRLKRKFDNIERKIQRMEHTVTEKEFDWK